MRFSFRHYAAALGMLAVLGVSLSALAVGTRRIELQNRSDFEGGDLTGVAIDGAGRVRAGFNLGKVPLLDGTNVWCGLALDADRLLLGTGNEGKLIEVKGGAARVAAESGALALTSMVKAWGGTIIVGALPDGALLELKGDKLVRFAKLPDADHVWDVAFDAKAGVLYAATGPEGKLFRVTRAGDAQVYFDAEEKHLMSVAVGKDRIYAGASDQAKLYEISAPGRANVLYDFGATEVRDIVVDASGSVYAIANEIKAGSYAPVPKPGAEAAPNKQPKTKGKGVLYRFDRDGTPERLLSNDDEHYVSLALDASGLPHVGTGVEGRVYTVDENHNPVLVADTEERQVGALLLTGKSHFLVTSDPAVLHPIRGTGGVDSVWTSKVLDVGLRARFGRLSWVADGELEFSTRSGNTKEPDATWSGWSNPIVTSQPVTSPPARYLQVRARWNRDPKAALHEVTIPFVTDNLRAVITRVKSERERGNAVSTGTGDVKSSGGPVSSKPDDEVSLSWDIDNPDNDELRYRLQYRLEGTPDWIDMLDPRETLTKASYTWNTSDLPEGRYRVRVVATDELANPPGKVTKHELTSSVVLIDNTPPAVQGLTVTGRRIQGTAVDGVGPIARLEVTVTGRDEWVPFYPEDGIFDEQSEDFDLDVASLVKEGRAMLSLRVYDQNNNFVVRNVILR